MVAYRLSFLVWRMRSVLQVLTIYYLWLSITSKTSLFHNYSQEHLLTYIFGTSIVAAFVFSTRTTELAEDINEGNLSNYLIRPLSYFSYLFARDMGDKLMNVAFSLIELLLLVLLLRPPFLFQTNPVVIFFTFMAICLAVVNNYFIGLLLGTIGFWSRETWAPRFIFSQIVGFFSGALFPLDILPKNLSALFQALPFSYLQYFPLKIYLGQINTFDTISGMVASLMWTIITFLILQAVWIRGLRNYAAYGR